ncbi:MAG: alpha/beta hydrolase-fold protein [Verrucomicrobiota bacterium]
MKITTMPEKNSTARILPLLALLAMGPFCHAQPADPATPAGAPNRGARGAMRMPKPGLAPLPILQALPLLSDTAFYAKTDVPHGAVEEATYTNAAGEAKRMHVYLPPNYRNTTGAYPVLYLNHGGGDDDSKWSSTDPRNGGNAQFILDNLIAAGKARPMIIVMPDTRRIASSKPPLPGQDDACTQEYLRQIIPYVETHYRAKPGRENRALAGLSMGGFVVLNTGLPHLDTFSELYVYSSGYIADEDRKAMEDNCRTLLTDPNINDRFLVPLYFAAGEIDMALPNSLRTLAIFNQHGIRSFWVLSDGAHEWANWRRYLWQTAQIMFPELPASGAVVTAQPAALSGQWQAAFDTQIGRQQYVYELKAEGGQVTGKARADIAGEKSESVLQEGKLAGDVVTFVENLDYQGNSLRITYEGKLAGDEIKFTRNVGDIATEEFTARRVAVTNAPAAAQPAAAQPAPANPGAPGARGGDRGGRGGRGGNQPITLGPDDKPAFPAAPAGFDAQRADVSRGNITNLTYDSTALGIQRPLVVYTPPGYTPSRKYPVLYLLHGIGDNETGWRDKGSANIILDNLYADQKVVPMIVVMPNGNATANNARGGGGFGGGGRGGIGGDGWGKNFEDDLLQNIIPFIESHYSALAGREHRALAGLSMGGGQTLNAGLGHLDTFAWIGGFSCAPNSESPEQLVPDPAKATQMLKLLWISDGNRDGLIYIGQRTHAYLKEHNVPHLWHVDSGAHEWPVWKNDLYLFSQLLFR